jgi:hypothetical protein
MMLAAILAVYGYLFDDVWEKVLIGINYVSIVSICDGSSKQQFLFCLKGRWTKTGVRVSGQGFADHVQPCTKAKSDTATAS